MHIGDIRGLPHRTSYNIALSLNQPVQIAHCSHMKYKHMDLDQVLGFPVASLQQHLEDQTWDSCILEVVELG